MTRNERIAMRHFAAALAIFIAGIYFTDYAFNTFMKYQATFGLSEPPAFWTGLATLLSILAMIGFPAWLLFLGTKKITTRTT